MENNLGTGHFHCFVDQFFDFYDAEVWVEGHLDDHPKTEWELVELRINLLGGTYRAGVSFRKLNQQLEFDFPDNALDTI